MNSNLFFVFGGTDVYMEKITKQGYNKKSEKLATKDEIEMIYRRKTICTEKSQN